MTTEEAARKLYFRNFVLAFRAACPRPLPEDFFDPFQDSEIESYRALGIRAEDAALDWLDDYWRGGKLLP